MRAATVKAIVDRAYADLEHACDPSHEATKLLRAAYSAAEQGERQHRRMGPSFGGSYRASVATAARYFVCKWFCAPTTVTSALEACSLRADCLNASALRELLDKEGRSPVLAAILELDYCRDLVADESAA